MPSRRLPNSVPTTLHVLKTARDFNVLTPLPADRAIDAATFAKLDLSAPASFLNRWLKELNDIALAKAAGTPITERLQLRKDRVALLVSHFHQVLDLGITRGAFAAGARSYYGRDAHDTRIPDLSTYEDIATAAEHVKQGEADRQTAEGASFIPMAMPSAAEVETARVQFKTELDLSKQADVTLDREEEEAGALYPEGLALAVDIVEQVEYFFRKDPNDASRRQKCTRWGVVYIFEPNEPGAPPPVNPPPANPPAPTP